jgi:hypothetical protein
MRGDLSMSDHIPVSLPQDHAVSDVFCQGLAQAGYSWSSVPPHLQRLFQQARLSSGLSDEQLSVVAVSLLFYEELADLMEQRNLTYLGLPPVIAFLAESPLYQRALPYGRGWYFDVMHTLDEQGHVIRDPLHFERAEIMEMVKDGICPQEKRLLFQPLAWRVGFQMGWLSALAASQKEDVQAAMVILAALVVPLLVPQRASSSAPAPSSRTAIKRISTLGRSSRKQSKKR